MWFYVVFWFYACFCVLQDLVLGRQKEKWEEKESKEERRGMSNEK